MQFGGQPQALLVVFIEADVIRQLHGEFADTQRMAGGVAVTCLQRSHQARDRGEEGVAQLVRLFVDDGFELFLLPLVFAAHQLAIPGRLQGVMEFIDVDRLEEIVLHAGAHALQERFLLGTTGDDDDGGVRASVS